MRKNGGAYQIVFSHGEGGINIIGYFRISDRNIKPYTYKRNGGMVERMILIV